VWRVHAARGGARARPALAAALAVDVARLHARSNLGRDDRVVGDHGREARFPFLVVALPAHRKCHPALLPRGAGDKHVRCVLWKKKKGRALRCSFRGLQILRAVARLVGLPRAAVEPKRALQASYDGPWR
jgi:hypothetical protein